MMASPKLPFKTFRIDRLPLEYTTDILRAELNAASIKDVQKISLARIPSGLSQTATLTVKTEHTHIEFTNSDSQIRKLDTEMIGFTTLSNASEGATAVEYYTYFHLLQDLGKLIRDCSIVAITGLAGKAFMSWQYEDGSMWLRDALPQDLKIANVHIYGYKSAIQHSLSTATLTNFTTEFATLWAQYFSLPSQQPMILVGHSLGCLIIKKMLVNAHVHSNSTNLMKRVYSIFLFGAPHRGLENQKLRELTREYWCELLVTELSPESTMLTDMNKNFAGATADLKIVTCVELQATPEPETDPKDPNAWKRTGKSKFMADKNSACLYYGNERIIEMNLNHSMMAKLSTGYPEYAIIRDEFIAHSKESTRYVTAKFDIQQSRAHITSIGTVLSHLATNIHFQKSAPLKSTNIASIFHEAFIFLKGFEKLLEDGNARALFLEPVRQNLGPSLANHLCKLVENFDGQCLPYRSAISNVKTRILVPLEPMRGQRSKSTPAWDQRLFTLADGVERLKFGLKSVMHMAVLQLDLSADISIVDDISLVSMMKRRRALLDSESVPHPMSGVLLPRTKDDNVPASNLLDVRTLRRQQDSKTQDLRVLVEYKSYNFNPDSKVLSDGVAKQFEKAADDKKRHFAHLVHVLQNLYSNGDADSENEGHEAKDPENCVLKCLGFLNDKKREEIALVFGFPDSSGGQVWNLYSYLQHVQSSRNSNPFSLRESYQLARTVCDSVLRLHHLGWLHKDICSEHIMIFFPQGLKREDEDESTISIAEIKVGSRFSSFLTNFGVARDMNDESSLAISDDIVKNFYRHPERQGSPKPATARYDWYSVGVVMLEIGLRNTIDKIFAAQIEAARKPNQAISGNFIKDELVRKATKYLPSTMGPCYADAVTKCLTGEFEVQDNPDEIMALCLEVQDAVLATVEYGCRL